MDSFKVTDEGDGIIRVDAETRIMRKPMAQAICAEVDELAENYGGRFKILMNMGAMSKGTPGAGLYTLRRMKEYDMTALALFRANPFMRRMAKIVLGLNGFTNFALFDDEVEAKAWLAGATRPAVTRPAPKRSRASLAAGAAGGLAVVWIGARRRARRRRRA